MPTEADDLQPPSSKPFGPPKEEARKVFSRRKNSISIALIIWGGLGSEAPQLELNARALARALILVYIFI